MSARLGKSGDETMKDFMAICGVVGRDSPDFIEKQQAIYDEYMKLGGFVKVRQWGRPCLGRLSGQDCPSDPKIPYELTWLQPRPPDPPDQPSAVNNFGGANGWFWSDAYFFMQFDNRPKEFVGGYGLGSQLNRQSLNWNPSHYSYPPQYAPVN